jgi:serine/threonine protein kinase
MPESPPCPDPGRLLALLVGELSGNALAEVSQHIEGCASWQKKLDDLGQNSWAEKARQLGPEEAPPEPALNKILKGASEAATSPPAQGVGPAGVPVEDLGFLEPPRQPGHLGRLGHYDILQVIGKGGMGVVLKAFDEKLHRVVAIKVLAPELATSGTARKRFIREARAAAAIRNDHVIAIHAVEEDNNPPYLVMEFIEGPSLQDKLDHTGPLGLTEILRIGIQTAEGLAAAHKLGLVHRDIKPANILLENGVERVKITDFGLARAVDDASLTQSGVVTGTPMYMAPEQAGGEHVDHRADLFSLGSVLYVMCTGRPPFRGSGTMAVLMRVMSDPASPIREINPDIPDWLADIVARLHAKNPAERFQSAREIAELLGARLAQVQTTGPAASGSKPPASEEKAPQPGASLPMPAFGHAPASPILSPTPELRPRWQRVIAVLGVYAGLFILFCVGLYFLCRALVVYPGYVALYIAITAGAGAAVLGAASLAGKPGGKGRRRLSFIAGFGMFLALGLLAIIGLSDALALGNVLISCNDPEVRLHLNGDWVDQDVEAGRYHHLPPGEYLLTAEKDGKVFFKKYFDVDPSSGSGITVMDPQAALEEAARKQTANTLRAIGEALNQSNEQWEKQRWVVVPNQFHEEETQEQRVQRIEKLGGKLERVPWVRDKAAYRLDLKGTRTSDDDLAKIIRMDGIQDLDLSFTQVTSKGIGLLAGYKDLSDLNLAGTKVTDTAIDQLSQIPDLVSINLAQTAITEPAVDQLIGRRSIKVCRVGLGDKARFRVHQEYVDGELRFNYLMIGDTTFGNYLIGKNWSAPKRKIVEKKGVKFVLVDKTETKADRRDRRREATAYYHRAGPVGQALSKLEWFKPVSVLDYPSDVRLPAALVGLLAPAEPVPASALVQLWSDPAIGVVRLNVGTLAAYGRPYQHVHFYNSAPELKSFSLPPAEEPWQPIYFGFIQDALKRGCLVRVLDGDERAMLGKNGPKHFYSALFVEISKTDLRDINTNLLTKEALAEMMTTLTDSGVLCFHVSNRHYNMVPPIIDAARSLHLAWKLGKDTTDDAPAHFRSDWLIVARQPEHLRHLTDVEARPEMKRWGGGLKWYIPQSTGKHLWHDGEVHDLKPLAR